VDARRREDFLPVKKCDKRPSHVKLGLRHIFTHLRHTLALGTQLRMFGSSERAKESITSRWVASSDRRYCLQVSVVKLERVLCRSAAGQVAAPTMTEVHAVEKGLAQVTVPRLVCLLSSVVTSARKLDLLRCLIESAKSQESTDFTLAVSCFVAEHVRPPDQGYGAWVKKLFDGVGKKQHVLVQHEIKPQFLGYADLIRDMEILDDTWLMFSDDDDLWSPGRVKLFRTCLAFDSSDVVLFDELCVINADAVEAGKAGVRYECPHCGVCCQEFKNSKDVEDALAKNCCVRFASLVDGEGEMNSFCVKISVFRGFVQTNMYFVSCNKYCDMLFFWWLKQRGHHTVKFDNRRGWLYFYRNTQKEVENCNREKRYSGEELATVQQLEIPSLFAGVLDSAQAMFRDYGMAAHEASASIQQLVNRTDSLFATRSHFCFNCGVKGEVVPRCLACKVARYCSRECQTAHWVHHSSYCHEMVKLQKVYQVRLHNAQE
jgi:hypothetical protein